MAISASDTEPMLVVAGSVTVPVNVGEALGALALICACSGDVTPSRCAISASDTVPMLVVVGSVTVPVNVGLADGALASIWA